MKEENNMPTKIHTLDPFPATPLATLQWLAGRSISRSTQAYLKHGLDIWSQETTAPPILHH